MRKKTGIAALMIAAMMLGACSDARKSDVLAEDTSLNRDLALANQDTASKPELRDVPVAALPAPIVSEPEPAPAPAPRRVTTAVVKKPAPRVIPKPAPAAPETPAVQVTATGNTERVSERGSEQQPSKRS